MKAARGEVNIRQWSPDAAVEPSVRIGIILDQDALTAVRLRLPDQQYDVGGIGPTITHLEPHTTLVTKLADHALAVRIGGGPEVMAKSLRLSCPAPRPLAPGAGVLVRDVVAGRGFHWQKRIDQTLAGAIELLRGRRGVVLVNELPLEEYLAGVITAEMSGACPADFLKTQCVVARSWLLAMSEPKHDDEPFDRCNDDCCQRYQGTGDLSSAAIGAVRATRGLVLLDPAGNTLDANYAKCCGGITESPRVVWGIDKPGLTPIVDAPPRPLEHRFLPITESNLDDFLDGVWLRVTRIYCSPNLVPPEELGRYLGRVDQAGDYFRWTVRYDPRELEQLLIDRLPEARDLATLRDLRVTNRGVSGRASAVELEWENTTGQIARARLDSEYRIREVLHRKFLYSSAFAVRMERDADGRLTAVTLRGAGWGHGVGLCQIGALGMALSGSDYESICRHYYPEARLAHVYE